VARVAAQTAFTVRLLPACLPATRATTPTFRQVETFTKPILTVCGDTMPPPWLTNEPFGGFGHLR
jgi:hypothetical protein